MVKPVLCTFQRNQQNLITQSDGDWSSTTGQIKLHYKPWELLDCCGHPGRGDFYHACSTWF